MPEETENARLQDVLAKARDLLKEQQEEIDKLSTPPNQIATFLGWYSVDERLAIVVSNGREMRVCAGPGEDIDGLAVGQQVFLSGETMAIIEAFQVEDRGTTATVGTELDDGRVIVATELDSEVVLRRAESLLGETLEPGATVLIDAKAGLVLELLEGVDETKDLLLEEVPDVTYEDIGGLDEQLTQIHDSIELPYLHPDKFAKYHRKPPKGILLYGPPGCGKTLVAKAVANQLATKSKKTAHFINIKGPELLNKWVGETERYIREIFDKARKLASEGDPVVIFFDEMESMFRQRGAGISSDIESTIVPSLLAEMDGVEGLSNVIVIGASNRQDLIDPAILRPGRLDVKILVGRPDKDAAYEIFRKYLTLDLPYSPRSDYVALTEMMGAVVDAMYAETKATEFLEVTYQNGQKEMLHFKDFASGAMIAAIVDRAKTAAIKDELAGKGEGISLDHLLKAVAEEFKENEDLPNTSNPDDWAKISGRKGERIAHVRAILRDEEKTMENIGTTGQYL